MSATEKGLATIILGTKIKKQFGVDWYEGEVVSIDTEKGKDKKKKNLFHVRYEDGDEEDLYLNEITSLVVPAADSAPRKRKTTAVATSAKKTKTSKTPHDLYFDKFEKFIDEREDIVGSMLVRAIKVKSGGNNDKSKFTKKQMNTLRFIMITKNRERQLEAIGRLVLKDQYGDDFMMFSTSYSYDVSDAWQTVKNRLKRKMKPSQKFDILLAFTDTIKDHSTWMHDNEGDMGVVVRGLATVWRNLLKKSDHAIGWDVEYTKPGTLELLAQFKHKVESFEDYIGLGKFKFL